MSLRYRTEAYIVRAIRQATFEQTADNWRASLPAFGLVAEGDSKNDAEERLLVRLTAHVLGSGASRLPLIDGIDPNHDVEVDTREPGQTWFWTSEWQAGEDEATRDIAEGRVEVFETADDFLASFPD